MAAISAGKWRKDSRADDWVGNAVANTLRLDAKAHGVKIKAMLQQLFASKLLRTVEGRDEKTDDVVGQNGGASNESRHRRLWRYIGRPALELGAHAPPAASIAVEKLPAGLALVEGQQDADWLQSVAPRVMAV